MIRSIAIVASALALAACPSSPPTDAACLVLAPITFSAAQDTPDTVAQIRRHNARLLELCPALRPR